MYEEEYGFECCERCGECSDEVSYIINPYYMELYYDEVWQYLCPDCYYEYLMDI